MAKFTKIYEDASDKNVGKFVLYTDDTYVYADEDCEVGVTKEDLEHLFVMGIAIATDDGYAIPNIYTKPTASNKYASVGYYNGTALVTLYSEEYTVPEEDDEDDEAGGGDVTG